MNPPGVIVNARAGRVARHPELVEQIAVQVPGSHLHLTREPEEVPEALRALRDLEVETLVIVGGDGSIPAILTPLIESWPKDALPRVLLAGGGSVNTIAKSIGSHGRPERILARLLQQGPSAELPRATLRVEAPGDPVRYGMIFVVGAPTRFLRFYYERSDRGASGALFTLLSCVGSILTGGPLAQELFRTLNIRVKLDGGEARDQQVNLFAASSVRHVGLGFKAFPTAGTDPGRFHWLAGEPRARQLAFRLPAIRTGRPGALDLFEHASARSVEVSADESLDYSIDAELYAAKKAFRVEAGPAIRFLSV